MKALLRPADLHSSTITLLHQIALGPSFQCSQCTQDLDFAIFQSVTNTEHNACNLRILHLQTRTHFTLINTLGRDIRDSTVKLGTKNLHASISFFFFRKESFEMPT